MKPNKETYFTMTAHEFDELVKDTYGHNFELLADQELYDCHKVAYLDGYTSEYDDLALLDFIQTGKYSWFFYTIANDMVRNWVLPKGEYLIDCT